MPPPERGTWCVGNVFCVTRRHHSLAPTVINQSERLGDFVFFLSYGCFLPLTPFFSVPFPFPSSLGALPCSASLCHALRGWQGRESEQLFPYGIYTIPEVSMIGKTEAQLTAEGVSYEVR